MPTWAVLALPPPSRPSCHQCRRLLPALEGPRIPRERHTPPVELPLGRGLGCPLPPDDVQPHAAAIPGGDPTDDWTAAAPNVGPMSVQTSTQGGRPSAPTPFRKPEGGAVGSGGSRHPCMGGPGGQSACQPLARTAAAVTTVNVGGGASVSKAGEILQTGRGPSMAPDKKYKRIPGRFLYVMVQCAPSVWSKQSHQSTVVAGMYRTWHAQDAQAN